MKEDRVTNKICIRLCDMEGNYKASYYTSNLEDSLAMYHYMMEEDIPIFYKEHVEDADEIETEAHIEDISVNFGHKGNLLSIDLYCEIMDWR